MTARPPIALVDLQAQRRRLEPGVRRAIDAVLDHGRFVMGPEVAELEAELARRSAVSHVVSCSSGTDALLLALLALGIGPGHAVLVPAFTFAATAEVVALAGATPVFVDSVPATFNVDPDAIAPACGVARDAGLDPRAVIPVDLFGQPADHDALTTAAADAGIDVVVDAAQSFGATWNGRPATSFGTLATTSFFPSKPLGCYGDGGAVFTDDDELARRLRSLRSHGQGADKYDNVAIGINGRLDTLQAAVLLQKLLVFDDEFDRRDELARRYAAGLEGTVRVPVVDPRAHSAWAQYTVRSDDRDRLAAALADDGIGSAIYYRLPLHRQPAYKTFPAAGAEFAVADRLAAEVLSIPVHPYLSDDEQDRIIERINARR